MEELREGPNIIPLIDVIKNETVCHQQPAHSYEILMTNFYVVSVIYSVFFLCVV